MEITRVPLDKLVYTFYQDLNSPEVQAEVARLAESIKEQGLLHPITVVSDGSNFRVISGCKRIEAHKKLVLLEIDAIIRAPSNNESELITHIHENLVRSNLPWYEQVQLESQLHQLRQEEHGAGKPGKKVGWSLRDTAAELNMAFGVLSEDIRMAEVILADPALKKIGDKKTARRVIFTALKQLNQEAEAGLDAPADLEGDKVYLGSSEQILKGFPPSTFHACITDPPWIKFKDDKYTSDEFTLPVFAEVYRVLTPDSFLFAFVSTDDFYLYRKELPRFGFNVQQIPNVWIKEGSLTRGKKTWEYERDYEPILVAVKGAPALTSSMLSAIYSCKIVAPMKMIHPNEKPKEVITKIIRDCTYEGALILDPFAGSGVVCTTAQSMRRRFVGIERDKGHYGKIVKRLEKEKEK